MRVVVITVTVAIVAAAVVLVGAVAEHNSRRALLREAEGRLLLEARHLALSGAGALLTDLPELTLHPLVRELTESRPEIALAAVVDHRGRVQGHADARALGTAWALPGGLAPAPIEARLRANERFLAGRDLLVAEVPVVSAAGQRVGTAVVGLRRAYVEGAVASARRQQILVVAGVLGVGVAVAFLVLTALLRPIAALRSGLERIGRGDLDTPIALRDRTELGLLADSVNDMASRLKAAQRETVERERLARELELARSIQVRLLPTGPHRLGDFVLRGSHRAAAEVGGDYFDVLPLDDGRVAVTIADVAGKGLAGCLVMSMLSVLLRALRNEHRSPSALLVAVEEQLAPTLSPGTFVTMFYGVLAPATGTLTFASAGHSPLLVWRAADARAEWIPTQGIPVGAVRGGMLRRTLEDRSVTLEPGDVLLQFTDGANEAENAAGEPFGFDRLAEVVGSRAEQGPGDVIDAVTEALGRWTGDRPPQDDQTLLAVSRGSAAAASAPSWDAVTADPVAAVADAEARGVPLALEASLDGLLVLRGWLDALPDLGDLEPVVRDVVETVIYELCANVVQHGLGPGAEGPIDVWWVPGPVGGRDPSARVGAGHVVVRDRGFPFHPTRRAPLDLARHGAWKSGRGLGLDLVRRAVRDVVFRPATTAGNVVLVSFDPSALRAGSKEEGHA
jgi:serine phosphatase RsbU (regulator of sigma subunit)/anti-sigma regulatory factor (Ser/Thr protein kinase)